MLRWKIFLSVGFAFCLSTAAHAESLRIATEGAYPPWNSTDAAGTLVGFEIDLAGELCRRMAVECQIQAQDWDGILPSLAQGKYDAVLAGIAITAQRAQVVSFSSPYAADQAMFAVLDGSSIAGGLPAVERIDLEDVTAEEQRGITAIAAALRGKVVAVQVSTIHAAMMQALFPTVQVRTYDKLDHAVLDAEAGRVDAVLGSRSSLDALRRTSGKLQLVGPAFSRGPLGGGVGVATRLGDPLADRFSQAIRAAAADGTTARLSMKWFGFDLSVR